MNVSPKESVRCPKCGSSDVRYSYTKTAWDTIMEVVFSMDAFRCRSCRWRFHKYDPGVAEAEIERSEPKDERAEHDPDKTRP